MEGAEDWTRADAAVKNANHEKLSAMICTRCAFNATILFDRSRAPDGLFVDMREIDFVNILPDNEVASIGGGIIASSL